MTHLRSLACLLVLILPAFGQNAPMGEQERIHHFLNRFALGPNAALLAEVRSKGIHLWFDAQLAGIGGESPALKKRLEELPSIGLTSREIVETYLKPLPPDATPEQRRERNRDRNTPREELRDSVLLRAVYGRGQVREAAADFFRNHFCVAVDKGRVRVYATEYEREVIRGHVFGSFGTMLRASAKHPAMLVYLDNVVSRRPPTKAELKKIEMRVRFKTKSKDAGREASDIAAQRGLNENYGRELLELHTLGVDNYYTQRDVENVAMALTGWTVSNDKQYGHVFEFKPDMHYDSDKVFLNRRIARNKKDPVKEGEKILDILVEHKGTAHYLAFKLCRHFVRDDPPDDLVERIARVFHESKGDLPTVYRAIVRDPEFFDRRNYRAKFKRPFEFVVSALRATGAEISSVRGIHAALKAMSEDLYVCKDPTGYYDQAEAWRDPGAFAVRWTFAHDLATGKLKGVRIPAALYAGLRADNVAGWKEILVDRLLPGGIGRSTSRVIDGVVAKHKQDKDLAPRIVALILGSPEFQQQ